jgi:hypothetical protein
VNASTAFSMSLEPCRSYRIAVACAGSHAPTLAIADEVASRLRVHGHIAVVDDELPPNPEDFSAVVLGCANLDAQLRTLADYAARNRVGLERVATALFLDGGPSDIDAVLAHVHWRPDLVVAFALPAEARHGAMVRWMLHAVGRRHPSAVAIKRFADAVATGLARATSLADLIRTAAC